MRIRKGDAARILFFLSDATDNETGETGLTPTVQVSKNGGALASATNAAVEISNGLYYVDLTTTETNTAGPLAIRITATGANTWLEFHEVYDTVLLDVEMERLTDILLRRDLTSVENSSYGDSLVKDSLLGVALVTLNSSVSGSVLTIKKTDTSTLGTLTITVDGGGTWTGKSL